MDTQTFIAHSIKSNSGLTGIKNVGNSCYINSVIQCLSHTPLLMDYFLFDEYMKDVNHENKITKGKVAESFGKIIKKLWTEEKVISPSEFKTEVGQVDSRWKGIDQQDAQEFNQFLLNCLHDDLNKVKNLSSLPIVQIDENGKTDEELAELVWQEEKKRNISFIENHFKGLFYSKLHCPCGKKSTKFDPFFEVQLQIPSKDTRSFNVIFYPPIGQKPKKISITMSSFSTIIDLKEAIAQKADINNVNSLVIAETYSQNFQRFFANDQESVSTISSLDDIVAFQLTPYNQSESSNISLISMVTVIVYQRCSFPKFESSNTKCNYLPELVGNPFLLTLPRRVKYHELHNILYSRIKDIIEISPSLIKETDIFSISLVNKGGLKGMRLLEFTSQEIVLGNESYLAIDWNPQSFVEKKFSKVKPEPIEIKLVEFGNEKVSLIECIFEFCKEEKLSKEESWYCPNCKEHKQAIKKMSFWKLPPILTLSIKRFKSQGFWGGRKITSLVECPMYLNLSDYSVKADKPYYTLFATIVSKILYSINSNNLKNHIGSQGFGHYTANCLNPIDKIWYKFDDDTVSKIAQDQIINNNTYILFYKQCEKI